MKTFFSGDQNHAHFLSIIFLNSIFLSMMNGKFIYNFKQYFFGNDPFIPKLALLDRFRMIISFNVWFISICLNQRKFFLKHFFFINGFKNIFFVQTLNLIFL